MYSPQYRRRRRAAHGRVDLDPVEILERVDGGHLVGDRADPADAGDDVQDLVTGAADDEPFEVPRRLEDPEARLDHGPVADPQAQRSLALDTRDVADLEVVLDPGGVHDERAAVIAVHRRLLQSS